MVKKKIASSKKIVKRNHKATPSQKRAPKKVHKRTPLRSTKVKSPGKSKSISKKNKFHLPSLPKSLTTSRGKSGKASKPKKEFIVPLNCEKETAYPVMNLDHNLMAGVLHEPKKKSHTVIIAIHGWTATKDQTLIRLQSIELSRAGYAVYRVDLSGNGDSEGRFEDSTPSKQLRDIVAIVEHFRKRFKKIILLGHSLGGTMAVIAAARVKLDGIVCVSAPMHPENFAHDKLTPQQFKEILSVGFTTIMKKRSFGDMPYVITERFVTEMNNARPLDAARDVHCPALIIHGTDDKSVPVSNSEELFSTLYAKDIFLIGGADHNITNPEHLDALISRVIEWLQSLK